MKIGYIRASTKDQNLARQIEMMKQECVEKLFSEKVSGKDMNRKELKIYWNLQEKVMKL